MIYPKIGNIEFSTYITHFIVGKKVNDPLAPQVQLWSCDYKLYIQAALYAINKKSLRLPVKSYTNSAITGENIIFDSSLKNPD